MKAQNKLLSHLPAQGLLCLLMVCLASASAVAGKSTSALDALPETPLISLKLQNVPVDMILERMSRQCEIDIRTPDEWLAFFPATLCVTNATVAESLERLLGNLDYRLEMEADGKSKRITGVIIRVEEPKLDVADDGPPGQDNLPAGSPATGTESASTLDSGAGKGIDKTWNKENEQ